MSNRKNEVFVSGDEGYETSDTASSSSDHFDGEMSRLAAQIARAEVRRERETIETLEPAIQELKAEKRRLESEFSYLNEHADKNIKKLEQLSKLAPEEKKRVSDLELMLSQLSNPKEFILKVGVRQDLVQFLSLPPYLQFFSEMSLSFPKELKELHALLKAQALQTGVSRKELAQDLSDYIIHLRLGTLKDFQEKYSSCLQEFQERFSQIKFAEDDPINSSQNIYLTGVFFQELKRYEHLSEEAEPWLPNDISFVHRLDACVKSKEEIRLEKTRRSVMQEQLERIEAMIDRREKKLTALKSVLSSQSMFNTNTLSGQGSMTPRA